MNRQSIKSLLCFGAADNSPLAVHLSSQPVMGTLPTALCLTTGAVFLQHMYANIKDLPRITRIRSHQNPPHACLPCAPTCASTALKTFFPPAVIMKVKLAYFAKGVDMKTVYTMISGAKII